MIVSSQNRAECATASWLEQVASSALGGCCRGCCTEFQESCLPKERYTMMQLSVAYGLFYSKFDCAVFFIMMCVIGCQGNNRLVMLTFHGLDCTVAIFGLTPMGMPWARRGPFERTCCQGKCKSLSKEGMCIFPQCPCYVRFVSRSAMPPRSRAAAIMCACARTALQVLTIFPCPCLLPCTPCPGRVASFDECLWFCMCTSIHCDHSAVADITA